MRKRFRSVSRVAAVAALALLLTGCLKLDMDLQIQSDNTVDGSVVFAVSKDVLELTGGSAEDLLGGETPFPSDVEGVTTEEYDDGEFAGQQFNFDGVPIDQFAADPTSPDSLSIVREGDTFKVSGALDLSQGLSGATGATGAAQFFESAEIRIAITFPGEVIESNGEVDGNTVSWTPEFGERLDISATGSAVEGGGGSSTLLYVLIGLGAVLLIGIIVAVILSRRRKAPEVVAAEAPTAEAPTAEMTAAAAPAVPPSAPEPPPVSEPSAPEPPPVSEPSAPEPPPVSEPAAPEPPPAPDTGEEGEVPPPPPPTGQA
jgi:hypothetical protein